MIKAKATQARPVETGPNRASFIESSVDKAPAGIATVGVILVSAALYLKGIVSPALGRAATEDDPQRPRELPPETAPAAESSELTAETDSGEQDEAPSAEIIQLENRPAFRARLGSGISQDYAGPIDSEPLLAPTARPTPPLYTEPAGRELKAVIGNDSILLPARSSGDAASGGGGGGGGGGSGESGTAQPPLLRNRAPVLAGPVTLRSVPAGETMFIAFAALLAGAVDPDGDVLRVVNIEVSSGTLTATDEGWIYTAPAEPVGSVKLTYTVTDGFFTVAQKGGFDVVERSVIVGTDGDDSIVGTPYDDRIDALGGDDTVVALAGNDVVAGGDGNDVLYGGEGHDTIFAGSGDDLVFAGGGNDIVHGGEGRDTLNGEAGADILYGEAGNDSLAGGDGKDVLFGGAGLDTLAGGSDQDVLQGDEGDDVLDGGAGHDLLSGGTGSDSVNGGTGNDIVEGDLDGVADTLAGGEGSDTLDYAGAVTSLTINLVEGKAVGVEIGIDTISGFETVFAGSGDDHFIAGEQEVRLVGGGGADLFEFLVPTSVEGGADSPASDAVSTAITSGSTTPAAPPRTVHEILDFTVGDRIKVGSFYIERDDDEMSGRFRDGDSHVRFELKPVGQGETLNLNQPFRLRIEERDGQERTVIDVVVDGVDDPDFAVAVAGLQSLSYYLAQN